MNEPLPSLLRGCGVSVVFCPFAKQSPLHENYPDLELILVEDALYANAPNIRQITGYNWKYILSIKPDSHQSLERQFGGRRARGQVKERRQTDAQGVEHYFAWTSGLCLCESASDVRVNYLLYEQRDKQGKLTRWTWITNLRLQARSVERVMRAGRSRWKIESVPQANRKEAHYELTDC